MSQVKDIFDAVKHKLPDRDNLYPAINTALRLISKRLFYNRSNLVRGELDETITADSSSLTLPTDFWGLIGAPYIEDDLSVLKPIPNEEEKLSNTENTNPVFYEIIGQTCYLYPGSSSAETLKGGYWTRPTKITSPLDTMPFAELFDDVIEDALLEVYGEKNMGLRQFIYQAVDEIAPYIGRTAVTEVQDAQCLDSLYEEEW